MDPTKINRLILDKLEAQDISPHVKGFIREILQHEKGGLDQERPHYTSQYKNLLNKHVQRWEEVDSER